MIIERFNRLDKQFSELTEKMRAARQRLAGLDYEARQSRLATEVDVERDVKTRKRTENAATNRVVSGDSSSAKKVDNGPTSLTSFGMIAKSPTLPCKDDARVDKGAEVPKPCLSLVEMRKLKAAGGLLPAGTASIAMRTIFSRILSPWSLGEETKARTSRTTQTSLPLPAGGRP